MTSSPEFRAGSLLVAVAVSMAACGNHSSATSDAGPMESGPTDSGLMPPADAGPSISHVDAGFDAGGAPDGGAVCAAECLNGLVCVGGQCACPSPTIACGSVCVDPTSDDQNCNGCGMACTNGAHCVASACTASNIQHVVLIVQENHTFDSYFGAYCQAPAGTNPTCTAGPSCCEAAPVTDPNGISPTTLDDDDNTSADPNHTQACEDQEIDNGLMDMFTQGSTIGSSLCDSACSRTANFAVAPQTTLASYWQYADEYALADRYFQPIVGSSSANDMYFAIAHEQFIDNEAAPESIGAGCDDPTHICIDGTPTSYTGRTTIADLLMDAGETFAVYADGYDEAVAAAPSCASIPSECPYNEVIHPIDAQSCLYDPTSIPFQYYAQLTDGANMEDYNDLATDIDGGNLPTFSFVKARTFHNEHPEYSTITDGISFVTATVQQVLGSGYADNTLILLTWDEGGGFFDHVPPAPSVDTDDMGNPVARGTRVPMLAIGVFAKQGSISHVVMDHSSVVRFLEYNFLTTTGQLGFADAKVNNIGSLLDPTMTGIPIPEQN